MSHSLRRTPITGITTAESDKPFKVREHRRQRRAVKVDVVLGREPVHPKAYGDPWRGEKDGKLYRGAGDAEALRK